MTVMSWLRLTVTLWLLRKAVKATGWLLLLTLAVALWPVTLVTAAGYLAAWLRGWPPARLRRAAVASLILAAVYAVAAVIRQHGARAALAPVRAWQHGWHQPAALEAARIFAATAPAAIPAGLFLAAGLWAWRIYSVSAGIGGRMASAPVTFDARQWRRQVRAATVPSPRQPAETSTPGPISDSAQSPIRPELATIMNKPDSATRPPAPCSSRIPQIPSRKRMVVTTCTLYCAERFNHALWPGEIRAW